MEELEIDCVYPETNRDQHLCSIDKSSLQQYKVSLQRSSNEVSNLLLDDLWQKHIEVFDGKGIDQLSQSVAHHLQNRDTSNCNAWKSSLSQFEDPLELFEKNIFACANCCSTSNNYSMEKLVQNSCTCDLGLNTSSRQNQFVKTLESMDTTGETQSYDNRPLLKPRFGKKAKFNICSISHIESTSHEFVEKDVEEENRAHKANVAKLTFKTAREQFLASNPAAKRTLGASRKAQGKFVSPMIGAQDKEESFDPVVTDERLKHIDPKMVELIESEIIDKGAPIGWDDIAGLQLAKSVLQEAVVWPLLRPDIFTGLRRPPRGILLFGPPGTGKTLIGKCVAAQCRATFFSISASSLTSKWIGDGEKMVRALFAVARARQPAVIFIDEIDSLLSARGEAEHEASRRLKTEFLVQLDGAGTAEEDRLLVVGATNRPQELDEAARRRLVKRLYIPLPEAQAREQIIHNLLSTERHDLSPAEISGVAAQTAGYSGADMRSLCAEAAMGPIRSLPFEDIASIRTDNVRPVCLQDFLNALQRVRPSVSQDDLGHYVKWNNLYGQGF